MPSAELLHRMTAFTRTHRGGLLLLLAAACGLVLGCSASSPEPRDPVSVPYLSDAAYRRAELRAALVNPNNGYSELRLAHYATGAPGDWDLLPEWNPTVEPIATMELDAPGGAATISVSSAAGALALPGAVASEDDPALLALGKLAFERYPAQLAPYLSVTLSSREAAASYGLWLHDARGAGGLVRVRLADGSTGVALTCSSCHAALAAPGIEDGLPNANLNLGAAMIAASQGALAPEKAAALSTWGSGRLDVTTSAGTEPVRIPDLRPVRFLTHLHHDATLVVRDRTTLAIRIETLIITSSGQVLRPPRVVALALAAYVASLADTLPPAPVAEVASQRGAQIFASSCAQCHAPPALTGAPVALATIGTDPLLGLSPDRGTGSYRVPSLRGVGTRGPLLHDGTVPSIDALFDLARLTPAFNGRLHGTGAVPGHRFGLGLSDGDRTALLAYVRAL